MKFKENDIIRVPEYGIFKIVRIVTGEDANEWYPDAGWQYEDLLYEYEEIETYKKYHDEYEAEILADFDVDGRFFTVGSYWEKQAYYNAPHQSPFWKVLNGEEL